MKRNHDEGEIDRLIGKACAIRSYHCKDREKISELLGIIYSGINLNEPHPSTKMLPFLFFMIEYVGKEEYAALISKAVKNGANPNLKFKYTKDEYLLNAAIRNVKPIMVRALLLSGADPKIADKTEQCFLREALRLHLTTEQKFDIRDQINILRSLLYYGADRVSCYLDESRSIEPLSFYQSYKLSPHFSVEICKLLVRFGSNIHESSYCRCSSSDCVNNVTMLTLLQQERKDSLGRIIHKVAQKNVSPKIFPQEMIEKILEYIYPKD